MIGLGERWLGLGSEVGAKDRLNVWEQVQEAGAGKGTQDRIKRVTGKRRRSALAHRWTEPQK